MTSVMTVIIAVATGGSQTVGMKSDGTVVCIGSNHDGECDISGWNN